MNKTCKEVNKAYSVQGPKGVLVQLFKYPESTTVSDSGIYMPKYKTYETDGGRPAAAIDSEIYTLVGRILQISEKAQDMMDEDKMSYKVGDIVSVLKHAKNPNNWFIDDKGNQVADFTGLLLITPSHLEIKVLDDTFDNKQEN